MSPTTLAHLIAQTLQAAFILYLAYFGWRVMYYLIVGDQNSSHPESDPLVDPAVQDLAMLTTLAVHDEEIA